MMNFKQYTIKDLAEVFSGYAFSTIEMESNGVPILKIGNIQNHQITKETDSFYSNLISSKLSKYILQRGDFLIAMTGAGSVGKSGKMVDFETPFLINQRVAIVRANPEKVDPVFLFYFYSLDHIERFLYGLGIGAGQPNISANDISGIKALFPSLRAQQQIASILSAYDSLIENNNKRIKILEQMAENLYKEWFVRFRFPGHETTPIENGIPHGWDYKPLFKVASVSYGYTFKSELFCEDSSLKPVVRIRDILDNKTNTYTSEECDEKYLISKHSILVGMDGIFHMCLWNGSTAYLNQRVVKIDSIEKDICNYLLYFAIRPQVKFWEQTISGTTVAHLGDKHLKKMSVLVPPKELLQVINRQMKAFMEEKNSLFIANQNLIKQRDLLLPRLMSGKLAV